MTRPISAKLPTLYGDFEITAFPEKGKEHVAITLGSVSGDDVLCRVHSECLTSEVFGSLRCDCREQLQAALARIAAEGRGVLVYLRQEGRGIGLAKKIHAYRLQDEGLDTVQANEALGEAPDKRDFAIAASILKSLGVKSVRLLTNNPAKTKSLRENGVPATAIPIVVRPNKVNGRYLSTKKEKLGHALT